MAMMQTEWNVEHRAGRCAATGRELAEGEEFYTVLFSEGEALRRVDVSLDAWTGPPDNAFCFFRSRVPPKEKRKRLLVDNDVLVNFFLRLADETEPARVQFRFVLALILMRKRLLKYEGSTTESGVETWTMTMGKEPVPHRVVNPRLTDDQIAGVSEQLSAILHSDVGDRLATGHTIDPSESHTDA